MILLLITNVCATIQLLHDRRQKLLINDVEGTLFKKKSFFLVKLMNLE